jgi:hypothetical protein
MKIRRTWCGFTMTSKAARVVLKTWGAGSNSSVVTRSMPSSPM